MNSDQFKNLLSRTNILDSSYPVKGAHVWLPDGFRFKKLVFSKLESILEEAGYQQYEFPRLMPGSSLRKIAKSVKDFSGSVFWLIDSDKPTDIFLNPTGESGIYTMLNRWIRHCSDLPIRLFQIGNTFRSHHRPYPLINSDESTPLLEGHGVFGTRKEATDEFDNVIKILENMHNTLVIPYRIVMRPQWGNNPVSEKNVSFESYFPPKGVNLNVGVAYFQDQLFSRIFEIVFKGEEEKREYTHQLTFGINERALAVMLSIHADDKGLRFIPEYAPIQVVIIPRSRLYEDYGIREYVTKIQRAIVTRTYVDDDENKTIKQKFRNWQERGVPIQIAINQKNVQDQTITMYRRDQDKWETIYVNMMEQIIPKYFNEIRLHIQQNSESFLREKIRTVVSYDDLVDLVKQNYMVRFDYCATDECGKKMEQGSVGEILGIGVGEEAQEKCIGCGNKATVVGYFSRRAQSP